MNGSLVVTLLALMALLPSLLAAFKERDRADAIFLSAITIGIVGPGYWLVDADSGGWSDGLLGAMWATVAATMLVFLLVSLITRAGWRLGPILMPYVSIIALTAAAMHIIGDNTHHELAAGPTGWLIVHALASVLTYAVATVGAVAATAGFIQQRAMKHKTPTAFSRKLPSVADCDSLQSRLLGISALALGIGLISGTATSLAREGIWLSIDHKTILGALAFIVISSLLVANRTGGMRARQIGRGAMAAYLLLTLAYIGVKFVTDVIL